MVDPGRLPAPQLTPVPVRHGSAPQIMPARRLSAVPDLVPDPVHDRVDLPLITVDTLPGRVRPGDTTEYLVMAANPLATPLAQVWLGLVLPSGVCVVSVTPPAGAIAVTWRSGSHEVVRTRLTLLVPGACVGLDVGVRVSPGLGPHRATAFVTFCQKPVLSLTREHHLQVEARSVVVGRSGAG